MAISFVGCTPKKPSSIVKVFFLGLKNANSKQLISAINSMDASIKIDEKIFESMPLSTKKLEEALGKTKYEINSETINGDKALVNVTVASIDLSAVLGKYIKKALPQLFSNLFSGKMTAKEIQAKQDVILSNILEKAAFKDSTGDFELVKKDGEWIISNMEDLIKLIFNVDPGILQELKGLGS